MKRNIIIAILLVLAAAVAGLGVATVTVGQAGASITGAAPVNRHYVFPQEWLDQSRSCYRMEREDRGIPGDMDAYVAWWHAHEGTQARAEWVAAYEACQDRYLWQYGMWNWGSLVLVSGG